MGIPSKGEICEGFVFGGDDRVHGYAPDDTVLCGAIGEDNTDPYLATYGPFNEDVRDFDPQHQQACQDCAAVWHDLPD